MVFFTKKCDVKNSLAEQNFVPNQNLDELIAKEKRESWKYGGR